jgi:hypothetical protein
MKETSTMTDKELQKKNVPLITAMTARYTLQELIDAYRTGSKITVYYFPDGKNGSRKRWQDVPSQDQLTTARTLVGIALGRSMTEYTRVTGNQHYQAPDSRSPVGEIIGEYERIQTYKWITDHLTHQPIAPNTLCWRCLHTGKISVRHPFSKSLEATG